MSAREIQLIAIDGSDTMDVMIKKINQNFKTLFDFSEGAAVKQHKIKHIAVDGQTYFTFGESFKRNTNSLQVFLNGIIQVQNESYVEESDTTIRFLEPLSEGDEVYIVGLAIREIIFVDNQQSNGEVTG